MRQDVCGSALTCGLRCTPLTILCCCSTTVTARRPFGRDSSLDYEVASDDEWEEEPEVRGPMTLTMLRRHG